MILALLLCQLFTLGAQAAPEPKLKNLILFELHSPNGYQQSSLEWNEKEITYITNSNFTQGNGKKALLGIFRAPLQENTKKRLEAFLPASKKTKSQKNTHTFQHSIEIKMAGVAIPAESKLYAQILSLMREQSLREDWIAEDGLQVELNAQNEPQLKTLSEKLKQGPAKAQCEKKSTKAIFCQVMPYGIANFLQAEKN